MYAAADWWLSTVRPAPVWLFSEFGAIYKYSDLLTYFSSLRGRQVLSCLVLRPTYLLTLVQFLRYSMSNNGVPLKSGLGVTENDRIRQTA